MRPLKAPPAPTAEERAKHEVDHCPYQAWCRSCVAGRGKADAHFRHESDEAGVPVVACDYAFMGEKVEDEQLSDKCLPILVHKFGPDRWLSSHVVKKKGPDPWAVAIAAHDLALSGLQKLVYKSDGEPSIKALKAAVVRKLRESSGAVDVQFEESGVGESQGNAMVERAIWEVESMARTLVHAAQELHGVKFELTHPIRVFAVEYASQLINRGQRAIKDNRTAYELRKGRPYRRKLPPFAEAVMFLKVAPTKRRRKYEDRWATGIYLGLVERSNMLLVGTPEGVKKVNCVKRLGVTQAKDPELAKAIKGYPWATESGVEGHAVDPGDANVIVATEPIVPEEELPPRLAQPREAEGVPRRIYIRREVELKKYGFTDGCRGCEAAALNLIPVAHSHECRTRIESAMAADDVAKERLEANRAARESAGAPAPPRPGGPVAMAPGDTNDDDADMADAAEAPVAGGAGRSEPSGTRHEGQDHHHHQRQPQTQAAGSSSAVSPAGAAPGAEAERPERRRALPAAVSAEAAPETEASRQKRSRIGQLELGAVGFDRLTQELHRFGAEVGPCMRQCQTREIGNLEVSAVHADNAIVSEVFCKNRFTSKAGGFGLHPGFALDYTTGWDLDDPTQRSEAFKLRETIRPKLLIGSPECSPFSSLQFLNQKGDRTLRDERLKRGRDHLDCCCQMYHGQLDDGNYFLHEHPHAASSWQEECVQGVLARHGVYWVRNDQCEAGLVVKDLPARKTTGWMTNSKMIADELAEFQCRNRAVSPAEERHEHGEIIGGKKISEPAGEYPDLLVGRVLRGFRRQLQLDGTLSLNALEPGYHGHEEVEIDEDDLAKFDDDVTGKLLPTHLVRAARREEIKFLYSFPVYEKVPAEQGRGKEKVSVRWCDIDKGDDIHRNIRSRLVGREYKWQNPFMQGTFAATPPLESLRYVLHWIATIRRRNRLKVRIKMLVLDVSRAHFHAPSVRELYIDLPEEDHTPGMIGRLLRTIYGTRDAANQWDAFFNDKVAKLGFDVGLSNPCLYRHRSALSIGWRHGDDLIFAGEEEFLDQLHQDLGKDMILKKRALCGFEPGDDKHITILNRLIDFDEIDGKETITYEPDPRHVDLLLSQVGMNERSKGVSTPGEKKADYVDDTPLSKEATTMYRSCTMRLAFLAADLPHLQFCGNRLARKMSKPTQGSWNRLKRAVRYLVAHPRWVQHFVMQEPVRNLDVWTDSDWASDVIDRKSVTSVVTMAGKHCLRAQTATQGAPTLSSGEAEFVANTKGGSVALGMQSMARDFGDELTLDLRTDSSASKGMASRIGLGKVRHLDTALLWLQHHVNQKKIRLHKEPGSENLADVGTKDVPEVTMKKMMSLMGFKEASGRHPKALAAGTVPCAVSPAGDEPLDEPLNGAVAAVAASAAAGAAAASAEQFESSSSRGNSSSSGSSRGIGRLESATGCGRVVPGPGDDPRRGVEDIPYHSAACGSKDHSRSVAHLRILFRHGSGAALIHGPGKPRAVVRVAPPLHASDPSGT